jgi:hypothetical protein
MVQDLLFLGPLLFQKDIGLLPLLFELNLNDSPLFSLLLFLFLHISITSHHHPLLHLRDQLLKSLFLLLMLREQIVNIVAFLGALANKRPLVCHLAFLLTVVASIRFLTFSYFLNGS